MDLADLAAETSTINWHSMQLQCLRTLDRKRSEDRPVHPRQAKQDESLGNCEPTGNTC